jgi:cellulose synthase/poly-beta-1,6-N-acetylglucosamine synthase-like glycosyltransferase
MEILLALAALPLLLPAFSLLVLTLAASRRPALAERPDANREGAPRVAILVPAHDESTHVLPTIACLLAELGPRDRMLVVADNCSDDTAALARGAGAEVIERSHAELRGKGYALAFGVEHLRADPPDVVLVVDADCVVSRGAVATIARECLRSGKPVQMLDLMTAGAGASLRLRVLEFAMVMKNLVRPLGSFRLGRACHLMGTGMALPWPLAATAELATGHVAEDMQLGIELTKAGYAPQFLPDVRVSSAFVRDTGVARVQKSRWEHGHLATLIAELPGLLRAALARRDPALAVLAMDLMIPPVAFYFLLLGALLAGTVLAAYLWPVFHAAATLTTLGVLSFALAIGLGWFRFGRKLVSVLELLRLPLYALWKLPVYVAFFIGNRSGWVRTRRQPARVSSLHRN